MSGTSFPHIISAWRVLIRQGFKQVTPTDPLVWRRIVRGRAENAIIRQTTGAREVNVLVLSA
jgi:hypothetical protein